MNVVVDKIVAVLQVLSFANAVGSNQHVYFSCIVGVNGITILGYRREIGEYVVKAALDAWQSALTFGTTGYQSRVQSAIIQDSTGKLLVQVVGRIGKGCKYQYLFVVAIDRVFKLVLQICYQLLQFGIVLWRNIFQHEDKQFQYIDIRLQVAPPPYIIHITQIDFGFTPYERIIFGIFAVEVFCEVGDINGSCSAFFKLVNGGNRIFDKIVYPYQGQAERVDATFQAFQQVNSHQFPDSLLSTVYGQALTLIVDSIIIFCTFEDK